MAQATTSFRPARFFTRTFILVGIAVGVGVWYYLPVIESKQFLSEYNDRLEAYRTGKLKELPGPYLAEGDASTIEFDKVDLGIAEFIQISENGDVLYRWHSDKPVEYAIKDVDGHPRVALDVPSSSFRLRKSDGTIVTFPSGCQVKLTPKGTVYTIKGHDGEFVITKDGKPFYESEPQSGTNRADFSLGMGQLFTDDLLWFNSGTPFHFLNSQGQYGQVDLPTDDGFNPLSGSSEIGTVGTYYHWNHRSNVSRNTLGVFKDGKITSYDIPGWFQIAGVVCTKTSVFLRQGPPGSETGLTKFESGHVSQVPMPPKLMGYYLVGANSKGEVLMVGKYLNSRKVGKANFPYDNRTLLLSGGKYFDLSESFANFRVNEYGSASMDEQGNIVVTAKTNDYDHLYLLRRKR